MRTVLAILLFAATVLGQSTAAPQAGQPPSTTAQGIPIDQENAKKAKALLDQMVQALGGQAYLNIQDISQQGRSYSFYHGQANSVGTLFWRFYHYPDKERVEFTKQRDVAYVYNGNKGYEITYKGTAEQEPKTVADYVRRRDHALDWVIRKWLVEPGVALFYEGATVAAERPAEQVTIVNSKNDSVTISMDATTHLPLKKSFSWRDPTDRLRNTEDEIYDGYREVEGVKTPFSITRFFNNEMSNQRFLNSVSYNKGLSDSMFEASINYDPNKPQKKKR
jgi:hypothetical protein